MALTGKVLVLRALGLGDLLTAVPALRAVRRALPGHEVVLATPAALGQLLVAPDLVDGVLPTSGLSTIGWRGPPPRVAVNLHGCGPQSHRLLQSLSPRRLIAFACPDAGVPGPQWISGEHEVRRWCRLVGGAGWTARPEELRLPEPKVPSPAPSAVVIHPGAAHRARQWPPERFAAVARWAHGMGHDVVVTGSESEIALARHVGRLAGLPDAAVLAGSTDLPALSALVAEARLVVCGDTGVAHLASAHGTPSVVLFGPVPPSEWGPPGDGPHTVIWHGLERASSEGRGDPFGDAVDAALLAVTVAEVEAAADLRLRRGRSGAHESSVSVPNAS